MTYRSPRRQGVIYGPPRPPRQEGALLGRIVGLAMIGFALAVLVGAVMLLNRPPAPTPGRSIGPSPSPSPTFVTPGQSGLPTAEPSAGPSASPAPTASPTPFVPVVQVGPGFVTFGSRIRNDRTVADPSAAFAKGDRIAWSAQMSEPADSAAVVARLLKLDPTAPGGERLLSEGAARPRASNALIFTRSGIRPGRDLDGPGIYVVRYFKGEVQLAEGYFELLG